MSERRRAPGNAAAEQARREDERARRSTQERDIQHAIIVALGCLPGVFVERMNTGKALLHGRMVQFGTPGRADLWVSCLGRLVLLEVKGPKGRLSPEQKAWSEAVVLATEGRQVFAVVRSVDEALAVVQRVLDEERR